MLSFLLSQYADLMQAIGASAAGVADSKKFDQQEFVQGTNAASGLTRSKKHRIMIVVS